jgi:predicted ATPase
MLRTITILRDRVRNPDEYPFNVPVIRSLGEIRIKARVCFFVGENGTGKSTLLEAIASHYGFGPEGGNRNFSNDSSRSNHSVEPLARALRLSFDNRTGDGFFLRAESFFNIASRMDDLGIGDRDDGRSLHSRSHGESFLSVLGTKFRRNGLFLLDEPEAALSPQRQLAFLVLIHDVAREYENAQFIISSHSPILLGYPGAQIFSFDGARIDEAEYEQLANVQIVRRFLNDRERYLQELFRESAPLFKDGRD